MCGIGVNCVRREGHVSRGWGMAEADVRLGCVWHACVEARHMGHVVHWMMKGGDVSMSYVAVPPIVDAQGMVPSVVNELWKLVRTHCTLGSVAADISPFSQFIPNKKDQPMYTKGPIYRVGRWSAQIYDIPLIGLGRDDLQPDISRAPSAGVGDRKSVV